MYRNYRFDNFIQTVRRNRFRKKFDPENERFWLKTESLWIWKRKFKRVFIVNNYKKKTLENLFPRVRANFGKLVQIWKKNYIIYVPPQKTFLRQRFPSEMFRNNYRVHTAHCTHLERRCRRRHVVVRHTCVTTRRFEKKNARTSPSIDYANSAPPWFMRKSPQRDFRDAFAVTGGGTNQHFMSKNMYT